MTPKDAPLVNYREGSMVSETNLDLANQQAIFCAAEAEDAAGLQAWRFDNEVQGPKGDIGPEGPKGPVGPANINAVVSLTDLASAIADTTRPTLLAGIGGGIFKWSGSDLSAMVTADARKGVYVPLTTNPSGSLGAWVRQFTGPLEDGWFSPDGIDDAPAIMAACAVAKATGVNHVRISANRTCTTSVIFSQDGLVVEGHGVKVTNSSSAGNAFYFPGNGMTFTNLSLALTSTANTSNFRNDGNGNTFNEPIFTRAAGAGVPFYLTGTNCAILGGSSNWYGGFFCNNFAGLQIIGHNLTNTGGDDNIVLKCTVTGSSGALIAFNTINGGGSIVAFGSEVGTVGVNDATYAKFIRNVQIIGNIGNGCSNILYFKPGAIPNYDYRNGLIEDVIVSDNILNDPTGLLFNRGFAITAGRGAIIRRISGTNNRIRARCKASGVSLVGAIHINYADMRAVSGPGEVPAPDSLAPEISGINIQVFFEDPYDAAAAGGAAPGSPAALIALIQKDTVGWGIAKDITLDVTGNGCTSNGIVIGADLDDVVYIRRARLTNVCKDGSNGLGGINYSSRVKVGDEISVTVAAGSNAKAYKPQAGGSLVSKMELLALKDIAAGTVGNRAVRWAAPRNCFVHKVEIVNFLQINKSADDVNFIQHEIRNESGVGANLFINNKLTGGVVMTASQFNAIYDAVSLTPTQLADCHYATGNRMSYTKNSGGTSFALTDASLRIHWAPF